MTAGSQAAQSLAPLQKFLRMVACDPGQSSRSLTDRANQLVQDIERQIPMARSLGRLALRAARTPPPVERQPDRAAATPVVTDHKPTVAIDGYDGLTARDVVSIVRVCEPATVAWVAAYESAGKARVTVLRAVQTRQGNLNAS